MSSLRRLVTAIFAAVFVGLAGCATGPTQEQTGAVLGGALGGVLGSQIGGGTGRTAAIIAGTLAGAAIGGSIGRTMDEVDRARLSSTLERQPDHRTTAWQNPNTGHTYRATPTDTYRSGGRDCREYTVIGHIDGSQERITGTACRDAQGRWINQ
ncbi:MULTISPECIES: RT0821/Lpp0805 family surface protein [unclassified Ectothiorhodospira]|uniref:RT0821/Lpp0805 family surface protein n=1 Tax=unclassified Ectothiorhodospira TaxID=2684909 RepID=UPI001EE937BF|nr:MULTISPECIES: RT0821/Lpp0805 family surface protein [unclassified Ectothiorhodospira]MCG5515352.1 glycine zipper 2TM domain-containing protein [Ectothiorhodospira sp. 9100]MCG5519230.1 glycine zipper 2TM domain-containing protein [Ectothiorhodospira sp. 9905]